MTPRVGQWLWSTCGACYYGQIVGVGQYNDQEHEVDVQTIDIRVEDPNDLIDPDEEFYLNGDAKLSLRNPARLELPEGAKITLRDVSWYMIKESIVCATPGGGCFRCRQCFDVHDTKEET